MKKAESIADVIIAIIIIAVLVAISSKRVSITKDYPECNLAQDPVTCVAIMKGK